MLLVEYHLLLPATGKLHTDIAPSVIICKPFRSARGDTSPVITAFLAAGICYGWEPGRSVPGNHFVQKICPFQGRWHRVVLVFLNNRRRRSSIHLINRGRDWRWLHLRLAFASAKQETQQDSSKHRDFHNHQPRFWTIRSLFLSISAWAIGKK